LRYDTLAAEKLEQWQELQAENREKVSVDT
jgi:hypothetical protein